MKTQKHDEIWNEEQLARILNFEPEVLEKRAAPETGVGERAANQFEDEVGVGEVGRFEQGLDEPVHTESSDDIVGNISQKNVASDNTQLSQADMFDEPHEGKTKPTFAANPFAKGGAVGLGLLVLFATAGLFLNSIMGTKLAKAPSKSAAPQNSKVQQQNTSPPPNEIGDYKTQAALSSQAQRLKAVEDARNNRAPNNLQRPEKPGQNRSNNTAPPSSAARPAPSSSRPASSGAPIPASRSMATPAPRPTSTSTLAATPVPRPAPSTPAATPVPRPTQSRPASTPAQSPTPVSRPAASTPTPTPVSRPASPSRTPETPTRPAYSAEERWQRLAQLGAYDAVEGDPSNGIIPGVNVGTNRSVNTAFNPGGYPGVNLNNQPALSGSNIPVQNRVPSPYGTPTEPVTLAGVPVAHSISPPPVNSTALSSELTPPELMVSRQPLSQEEQAILSETPQTTEENVPASVVVSTSTDVQTFWQNVSTGFLESTAYDEAAPINPNTVGIAGNNFIKVGQLVPGQLVTPVAAIDSGNRQNQTGNIGQRFVVALTNPLLASDGAVLFPASSQVVFEVKNVQKNGLVEAVGVALIDGQVEYRLPIGAISIRGQNGEPLIAERRRDDSGLFGRDLQTFGLGAAAKVGEVLNRPQRESTYSGFGGGGSTVERGSPNILGAVLEGGFSPVLESNTRRNERAVQEIESRPPLWYIEQGKNVQIFINSSFQLQQS